MTLPDPAYPAYPLPPREELVAQALTAMGEAASLLSLMGEHEKAVVLGRWRVELADDAVRSPRSARQVRQELAEFTRSDGGELPG